MKFENGPGLAADPDLLPQTDDIIPEEPMVKAADKGSIRTRLKMAFIGLSLGPLVLLGIVLVWQSYRIQLAQSIELQHEISKRALGRIRNYFHDIEDQLGMAAGLNGIMALDRGQQKKILSGICSYRNEYHGHFYDALILLDRSGRELAHVSRDRVYAGEDLREMSGEDEFRIPMAEGKLYYGPVLFDRSTGEPSMTLGKPVIDIRTGRPEGVLVAEIRLKDIWGLVADLHIGSTGSAYLLDGTGKVIAHKDPSLVLKGTSFSSEGNSIRKGLTGAKAVVDAEEIMLGGQRLFLVTERPVAEALALTFRIMGIIGAFLAITISGTVVLGLLVKRQVIGPIESLADTVQAISGGDLSRRAEHTAEDEIGVLVDSCNIMTKQLIGTIDSLTSENAERRKAEERIKASLVEKELLLREIHHRVKNNMQVISSLLDIQSGYVTDKAVSRMFNKSRDRIRTMALIHEKLYGSEDMAKIDFAEYLRDLMDYVHNVYATDPEEIALNINVDAVRLDINTAVPLALIVHELLSNALIHAFSPGGQGSIRIDLFPDEAGRFTLIVADDGVGFPKDVDPMKPDSLGMQLVNTLVRQLRGEIEINRSSGTEIKIAFRQLEQRKRRKTSA